VEEVTQIVKCLRGLPGSGKSTYAKRLLTNPDWVRVNRDDLRASVFGGAGVLSHTEENLITKMQRDIAAHALQSGLNVVVDDTNLRNKYLREWNKFALQHGAFFDVHDIDTPVDVCVSQDSARDRAVGEDVIREMAAKFTKKGRFVDYPYLRADLVEKVEPYLNPSHLPHTVIVDIDGTMALMGDRDPYNESTVSQDKPNWPVVRLVQTLIAAGDRIIFLSGRTDGCFDTASWLNRYIPRDWANWLLLMRKSGDNRRDDIVKREIFDAEIRDKYHVKFVLDDRMQVVLMWRNLGLACFQVAPGDF
jgi:predicted kinase